jgi:hypothetical protein
MNPTEIVSESAKLFIGADVQSVERLCNTSVRDAGHLDVLFRENAAKGRIVGVVTWTITNEEHIRYPCVVFLNLTVTIGGVNKQIDKALLPAFVSRERLVSS